MLGGSFYTASVLYFSILLAYAGDKCAISNQLGGIATLISREVSESHRRPQFLFLSHRRFLTSLLRSSLIFQDKILLLHFST